jgi:Flp pilus assembly protein TadG
MKSKASFLQTIRNLRSDNRGAMMIETALVTPMLVMMALGSFDASRMFAREAELQTAASEAAAIALASKPDTSAKRTTLKNVIVASTGLAAANVSVDAAYRCGITATYVTTNTSCGSDKISNYVKIYMTGTYTPQWTQFGIGGPITYRITRYVMIGQDT